MKRVFYVVSWQYWETNHCCWGYITHIFIDKQARDEMFDNLCPVIHEYPKVFEKNYTDEEIAGFLNNDRYCVHFK